MRLFVVMTGMALGLLAGAGGAGYLLNEAPGGWPVRSAALATDAAPGPLVFTVHRGEPLATVADRLYLTGAIRSPLLLRVIARANGTETSIKAGYFTLPRDATTLEIHDLLVEGHQQLVKVTIPEGWTINKIGAYLEAKGVTTAQDFVAVARSPDLLRERGIEALSAEGYLFPDTYHFPKGYAAEAAVRVMMDTFFERLEQIYPAYAFDPPDRVHATVVLASIVEREYRVAGEAPLIASVFLNRLGVGVGLESCATLEYIITEIEGKPHPERIFHSDLKIDSDYNTYLWAGLPPGPISNPGMTALQAAFFPAETDYWYFVVKNPATGAHHFSGDLDEHNEAKFIYLKGVAAGG